MLKVKGNPLPVITVGVASENPDKAEAIRAAFERHFLNVTVIPIAVNSGVPEQPEDNCVFEGAKHRLEELKANLRGCDFYVSCEGGLLSKSDYIFNAQVVFVEDKRGKRGVGISPAYEVPKRYIPEILAANINVLFIRLFRGKGGTRVLTKNRYTRKDLIEIATEMALVGVLNGDKW
jgi:inosine/xanthosine triphosphatase